MKKDIIKEKFETNEYGVTTRYALEKWYKALPSGNEYNVKYVVMAYLTNSNTGYFRSYTRLANAMKDSYVENYL